MGGDAAAAQPTRDGWFAELAGTLPRLEVYGLGVVVVDLGTGGILGATDAARDLFGSVPADLDGLVAEGLVARPDLRRLRQHFRSLSARGTDDDSWHSWSDDLRLHRPDGQHPLVHLEIVVQRQVDLAAEAAVITVWPAHAEPEVRANAAELDDIWAVYDEDLRMVAADPGFADLGIDPNSQLGAVAWMYMHPEDTPAVQAILADVFAGRARSAAYTVRLRAREGRWVHADIEVQRLVGRDGPQYVIVARYVDEGRSHIPPATLTPRELEVVLALFDGLRVSQIADRLGLAVKTVRHHLAAIYQKLDVSGQVELLASYHRPPD